MKSFKFLFVVLMAALVLPLHAAEQKKLHVVCTLPTLKALVQEVGVEFYFF